MKKLIVVAATAVVVGGFASTASAAPAGEIRPASGTAVAGSYIVVLHPNASSTNTAGLAAQLGGTVGHVYTAALRGFELTAPAAVARRLAAHPDVSYVEQNAVHQMAPVTRDATGQGTQPNPPSWGLDRIDQRNLPLDNVYNFPTTGLGVHVYVFGTGIRFTHTDFGGRAISGRDVIDNDNDASDCNGNGTHLAGTAGGASFGVAKQVTLVAVRNLTCAGSGTTAQVVAGIDWVTANAIRPAVGLLTLGGPVNVTFENAVSASIASGITYTVGSGASNSDACNFTPARIPAAITVSATDITDTKASFANFGPCLDIFAPGVSIPSTWFTSDTATATLSGTSMATAHVAGAAAMILEANPTFTPAQVATALANSATPGVVINPGAGSPNRLLFVGGSTPPPACTGGNTTNVAIPDSPGPNVHSPVTISGCTGNASPTSTVEVHIIHPFRGDLRIAIVAPDGTEYLLQPRSNDSGDDIHTTYVVNLSSEARNGLWRLRVRDRRVGNTGFIDSWILRL